MMVNAYSEIEGADICIHPTVAEILSLIATRMRLMGKKKKFAAKDTYHKKKEVDES